MNTVHNRWHRAAASVIHWGENVLVGAVGLVLVGVCWVLRAFHRKDGKR